MLISAPTTTHHRHVCSLCPPRLELNTAYKSVFDMVRGYVDGIVMTMWRANAKHNDVIGFCKSNKAVLSLLMPKASLAKICSAANKDESHAEMLKCIDDGSEVAERMFSSSVAKSMEDKIAEKMEDTLNSFVSGTAATTPVDQAAVDACLASMLEAVESLGAGCLV